MTINDHKYQISTRLPTRAGMFDPLLNCPICLPCLRWPFVDLCNKHRQPPPPVTARPGGGGCQQSAPGPVFVLCSSVTNLTCDFWRGDQATDLELVCVSRGSKLCVTTVATNICDCGSMTISIIIMFMQSKEIIFSTNSVKGWRLEIVQWVGISLTRGHPAWSPVSSECLSVWPFP